MCNFCSDFFLCVFVFLRPQRAAKKEADIQLEKVSIETHYVQEELEKMKHKMEQVQQAGVRAEVQHRQARDQLEVAKSKFSDLSKQRSQEEAQGGPDASALQLPFSLYF